MAAYGIPDNPGLETDSRLRRWWLHAVRGYKVLRVRHRPGSDWRGRARLCESYLMAPRDAH